MRLVLLAVRLVVWWLWMVAALRDGLFWLLELLLAVLLPPG